MIKKLVVVAIITILAIVFIGYSRVKSYVKTAQKTTVKKIEKSIPTDVKIDRIEVVIDDLKSNLKVSKSQAIELKIDIKFLEEEVYGLEQNIQEVTSNIKKNLKESNVERNLKELETIHSRSLVLKKMKEEVKLKKETLSSLRKILISWENKIKEYEKKCNEYDSKLISLRAKSKQVELKSKFNNMISTYSDSVNDISDITIDDLYKDTLKSIQVEDYMIQESTNNILHESKPKIKSKESIIKEIKEIIE